ncbi:pyruvate dehydrogenase E1 component alpha subunit [Sulfobacillus thermosulfidooxidans DSM 9293]|uniref:Pyruvate dehydrogenase E1 component alpha subunit n=2 Tax=Sulfobacillus thermosulfidooxidans TaxID=28034 RepID=A0A1W1WED2_SULTA|nr:thiamine pyrophosphate-dependent dehydrogenase E1 component subunit alpha [Sulfobacillus thermosulfidooxidans]SMC04671.1 pyruvate dehydrogenase E1 component alpha subunit [Sulfobacillus thermosulfidooxidans DSM 9293]
MYRTMCLIRRYEDRLADIYTEGKSPLFSIAAGTIPGEMHLAAGQEPVAVGVIQHLRQDDVVTAPHRPHHFAIAKGVNLRQMTAEIFGRRTGLSRGKGGHMHLFDPNVHFSCSGIVGAGFPPAVGAALAFSRQGRDNVAVAFAGEGAANQGTFHESLNLASVWKVPVVFVIEDNHYAISVPKDQSTSIAHNSDRAHAYGIPGIYISGNDVIAISEAAEEAISRAREGRGPTLLEIETTRLYGHFQGDAEAYLHAGEKDSWRQLDPIKRFRDYLIEHQFLTEQEDERIQAEVSQLVEDAVNFARESPEPAPEEALRDVFMEV